MFRVVISPMHFDRVLFCYSILVFAILTIKKKEIWLPETSTQIFIYSERYISVIISNKTNGEPSTTILLTAATANISFIYKRLLQTFGKSICLVKEFFLVKSFVGVLWGILRQVSAVTSQNTSHFWYFFHCTIDLSTQPENSFLFFEVIF